MADKQAILILYSDGSLALPGAQTYGNVRVRFEAVARAAAEFERRLLDMPLPQPPPEGTDEAA